MLSSFLTTYGQFYLIKRLINISFSCLNFVSFISWQPIMKFINDQYEVYLQEEININRKKRIPDSRVHCCIYFIPPTGHW